MKYIKNNSQGSASAKVLFVIIFLIVLVIGGYFFLKHEVHAPAPVILKPIVIVPPPAQVNTYGMTQYTDTTYGFSFWYPSNLQVTATASNDTASFPGGTARETLEVGDTGGVSLTVVDSPMSTITDEPNGHASPINQTKYSYDTAKKEWIISFPEGVNGQGSSAPRVADTSQSTMSGLYMLPAGKRFDTTIIPLSTTRFIVVSDGGGSSFTPELTETVTQAGAVVDPSVQGAALQAESAAYTPE